MPEQMSLLDPPAPVDLAELDRIRKERHSHHTSVRTLAKIKLGQAPPLERCEAESFLRQDRPYLAELEACIAELDEKWPECPELEPMRWGAVTLRCAVRDCELIAAGASTSGRGGGGA